MHTWSSRSMASARACDLAELAEVVSATSILIWATRTNRVPYTREAADNVFVSVRSARMDWKRRTGDDLLLHLTPIDGSAHTGTRGVEPRWSVTRALERSQIDLKYGLGGQ